MNKQGYFLISLDFELYWGVHDKRTLSSYQKNLNAVWEVIPRLIALFDRYDIKCTFATVGFLFAQNRDELNAYLPKSFPKYIDDNLSSYGKLDNINFEEPTFNALPLIKLISETKHELGTHTFSHYYCLEEGQDKKDFEFDLIAAKNIANKNNLAFSSIVFPRNQVNPDYFDLLKKNGVRSYRGTEERWMYRAEKNDEESLIKRLFRLMDSYFNLSGANTYALPDKRQSLYNFPSSRLLRPYHSHLKFFEKQRLKRITKAMDYAALNNQVFHLWWHPHNFGDNMEENFSFLEGVLKHFSSLSKEKNFKSVSMQDLVSLMDARK